MLFEYVCAGVGEARVWIERCAESKYVNTGRMIIAVLDTGNTYGSVSIVVIDSFSSSLGEFCCWEVRHQVAATVSVPRKLSEVRSLVWEAHLRTSKRVHLFALHQ